MSNHYEHHGCRPSRSNHVDVALWLQQQTVGSRSPSCTAAAYGSCRFASSISCRNARLASCQAAQRDESYSAARQRTPSLKAAMPLANVLAIRLTQYIVAPSSMAASFSHISGIPIADFAWPWKHQMAMSRIFCGQQNKPPCPQDKLRTKLSSQAQDQSGLIFGVYPWSRRGIGMNLVEWVGGRGWIFSTISG